MPRFGASAALSLVMASGVRGPDRFGDYTVFALGEKGY